MQEPDTLTDGTIAPVQMGTGISLEFEPDRAAVTVTGVLQNSTHHS